MGRGMSATSAIVVEGGAMRGVFSAGVLDVFHEQGFHPFDLAIGVSAGACNLASHLAGQHGRNRRSYFDLMTQREFLDLRRFFGRGSAVDLDWLWDTLAEREPLDVPRVIAHPTHFLIVATSASTGEPVYLQPTLDTMFDLLKGSCALPLLYRREIHVEGQRIVDGGVTDPIPVRQAYNLGARRIVVVRSRPAEVVKSTSLGTRASALMLRPSQRQYRKASDPPSNAAIVPRFLRSRDFVLMQPRLTIFPCKKHCLMVLHRQVESKGAVALKPSQRMANRRLLVALLEAVRPHPQIKV